VTDTPDHRIPVVEDVIHLQAGETSIVVLLSENRLPRILHWGEALGDTTSAVLQAIFETAVPGIGDSAVTYPQPVPVLPQIAEGWLGRPGLVADREGKHWAALFTVTSADRRSDSTAEALTIRAHDLRLELELEIEIEVLHASGLVRQRATLRNVGSERLRVGGIELALPVPQDADEVIDFTGRWALEKVPQRRTFDVGEWIRTSRGASRVSSTQV
jgi:alpha-galactosidase